MLFALTNTFHSFRAHALLPDALRLAVAAAVILGAGIVASYLPLPGDSGGRLFATLRLGEISAACLLVAWPALLRTGAVTAAEGRALFGSFVLHRDSSASALAQGVSE